MNRSSLLLLMWALLRVSSSHAAAPNVVLMMGDDHGWEETGYNGHPHVKTPVLDEMARTGLRFDRFYAAHPSCSPTRASFLTGRHPKNDLARQQPTVADQLQTQLRAWQDSVLTSLTGADYAK